MKSGRTNCCVECFDYDGIKKYIESNNSFGDCEFCGSAGVPIASVDEVGKFISQCVEKKYEDAANSVGYESAEGGYNISTDTIEEILIDELEIFSSKIIDSESFVCDLVGNDTTPYVRIDPYGPKSGGDDMLYMWEKFCKLVKSNRRFTVMLEEDHDGEYHNHVPTFINNILAYLLQAYLVDIDKGKTIYRSRIMNDDYIPNHKELTSPPHAKTINNRMSPKGVRLFYGSLDIETSVAETGPSIGSSVCVGEFILQQKLSLLDLASPIATHDIFHDDYNFPNDEAYNPFLTRFVAEVSKPMRHYDTDIEYLPTQIFTELVRFHEHMACDGILYRSAQKADGINVVLFNESNISTEEQTERKSWLRYCGYIKKEIQSIKYQF